MRFTALLFALFILHATDGLAGVLRLPLTSGAIDTAPFPACSSSGRLRAFYGEPPRHCAMGPQKPPQRRLNPLRCGQLFRGGRRTLPSWINATA